MNGLQVSLVLVRMSCPQLHARAEPARGDGLQLRGSGEVTSAGRATGTAILRPCRPYKRQTAWAVGVAFKVPMETSDAQREVRAPRERSDGCSLPIDLVASSRAGLQVPLSPDA